MMYHLILIDADIDDMNKIACSMDWDRAGFCVAGIFSNETDAMAYLRSTPVDAVLLGEALSDASGIEVAELIHKSLPDCSIVMMGSLKDYSLMKRAMQCGACDFILKPVDPEELVHSLEILRDKLDTEKKHSDSRQIQASRKLHNEYRGSAELAQRVIAYVDKHILDDISLEEVSKHLHISTSHLIRVFKKETGYTFLKYVTKKRMEKAAEYFAKENLKVREVSERLGYHSTRHFSTLFYKQFGCYPSEYYDTLENR